MTKIFSLGLLLSYSLLYAQENSSESNSIYNNDESLMVHDKDEKSFYNNEIPTKLKIQYYFYQSKLAIQGHFDLTSQAYLTRPEEKHKGNLTGSGDIEFEFTKDNFEAVIKLYGQVDSSDTAGSSDNNDRTFVRVDEFLASYNFDYHQIQAGRNIRFWGALEADNLADTFNNDDLRSDPFNAQKIGAWNLAYKYYTDSGEISAILKVYEEDRKRTSFPYVYNFFAEDSNYDESLNTEESAARPSLYLTYSGSTETEHALDYAFIFENGYDSQRYYEVTEGSLFSGALVFQENAYLVNKFITYDTLVLGSTLLKFEGIYADVIDNDLISDYYHVGLGLEHTFSQFYEDSDLGLITEYYKYGTFENDKYNDLDLFEVFQNDLFLGTRYSFNKGNDASILVGVLFDLDYSEQAYSIEYESNLAGIFKLNLDYYYIEPSKSTKTVYNLLGRHQRLSLKLGYYF